MVAFYLYLGILAVLAIYSLVFGLKNREIETLIVSGLCFVMVCGIVALKSFDLYSLLLLFFLFSGLGLVVVSDLGLVFMNPTPWKTLIKEFPTYTGLLGLVALVAATELWMEYDKYWGIFQVLFGGLMTITFITAFVRVIRWRKTGNLITATLLFAAILYYALKKNYIDMNEYFFFWIASVCIQSVILFLWRAGVKLGVAKLSENPE